VPIDELPTVIETYQHAHDRHDTEHAIASFGLDATVTDEDTTFTGIDRVRWWLVNAAAEYTFTRTLTGVEQPEHDVYIVHNHLSGNFPGGEVDLHYRFELRDGVIHHLHIAP
jgi:hypothetical protein